MAHTSSIDPCSAAFLSFLIPGWGQIRRGKVKVGFIWMLGILIGYFLMIFPGLIFMSFVCWMRIGGIEFRRI